MNSSEFESSEVKHSFAKALGKFGAELDSLGHITEMKYDQEVRYEYVSSSLFFSRNLDLSKLVDLTHKICTDLGENIDEYSFQERDEMLFGIYQLRKTVTNEIERPGILKQFVTRIKQFLGLKTVNYAELKQSIDRSFELIRAINTGKSIGALETVREDPEQ